MGGEGLRGIGKEEKERGGWFGQPWLPVRLAFLGLWLR